jgi:hypothetical protein
MIVYKCYCDYETVFRTDMQGHINRTTSCNNKVDMKTIDIDTLLQIVDKTIDVYRCCYCGLEMMSRADMQRHLNRKTLCIIGARFKEVDVNTMRVSVNKLQEKTHPQSFKGLTPEQKKEKTLQRIRIASNNRYIKKSSAGYMSEKQYASYMFDNIREGTRKRNKKRQAKKLEPHPIPNWAREDVLNILTNNQVYTIENTHTGTLKFPLRLTNGYFNSASFDRIDDNLGYENNYEIRPQFLNNLYKLTVESIKELVYLREQKQNPEELINNLKNHNFFYKLSRGAELCISNKDPKRNITFDFKSVLEYRKFIIKKYIEQGGRCAYSNVPIYPIVRHKFKISVERIDPRKSYTKDNICLIVVGLNTRPCGQFLNPKLTKEQQTEALKNGSFNQAYWDSCTNLTEERRLKCIEAKEHGVKVLTEYMEKQKEEESEEEAEEEIEEETEEESEEAEEESEEEF